MSDDKKYGSVDELLDAVRDFIKAPHHTQGHFTGFKVQVFLGRGVHEFKLDNEEGKAVEEVAHLKKRLEEAEKKLQTVRESVGKKRARVVKGIEI